LIEIETNKSTINANSEGWFDSLRASNKGGSISQKELSETAEEYLGLNLELIDQAIVACAKLTDA
jgi:hypothetical protein